MKISYLLNVVFCIALIGCSTNENPSPDNGGDGADNFNASFVESIMGEDHMLFKYENGVLIKGLGNSDMDRDVFHGAFQIEYGADNKVLEVIEYSGSLDKDQGFNFDLNEMDESANLSYYEYHYKNGKLSSITEDGELHQEFFYNGEIQVNEFVHHRNNGKDIYEFEHDGEGLMQGYEVFNTYSQEITIIKIESDNQMNPFYVMWKENSLVIPYDMGIITDENFSFYPHNILEKKEGTDINFLVRIDYEDDYPVIYDVDMEYYGDREPMSLNYL